MRHLDKKEHKVMKDALRNSVMITDQSSDSPAGSAPKKIFSGEASQELWAEINSLDAHSTGDEIRAVLYSMGCALQELEAKVDRR